MSDLGFWASMMVWPAGVLLLAAILLFLQNRTEVRWAKEAREREHATKPAE